MLSIGSVSLGEAPRVVVAIRDGVAADALTDALNKGVSILEYRIDQFASTDHAQVERELTQLDNAAKLATIRSAAEGGAWRGTEAERAGLFATATAFADAVDIELSSEEIRDEVVAGAREAELQAEVDRWLKAAEAADQEEDRLYGDKRGDELPAWVADKQKRLEKIRQAKAELEAEAKAAAEEEMRQRAAAEARRKAEGRKKTGKTPAPPRQEPDGKAQRNFTDPQSRILKAKDGYIQGYNAQAAVDAEAQIIVAHGLTPGTSDQDQLVPLVDGIEHNLGRKPKQVSADCGYCSETNLAALADRKINAYIAVGRAKHPADAKRKIAAPLTKAMRDKLKRAGYRSRYRLRKQIVEPVFGQIKQARGFRQFLLRGIDKVSAEWALICTAHNLTKLAKAA